jgi:hypothetical protein
MFWSLLTIVTVKYVMLIMRADNAGEGGIMALLGLAAHSEADQRRRTALLMLGLAGAALQLATPPSGGGPRAGLVGGSPPPMVFVPDAEGTGTVLLAAEAPSALDHAFGPGSADEHARRGEVRAHRGVPLPHAEASRLGAVRAGARLLGERQRRGDADARPTEWTGKPHVVLLWVCGDVVTDAVLQDRVGRQEQDRAYGNCNETPPVMVIAQSLAGGNCEDRVAEPDKGLTKARARVRSEATADAQVNPKQVVYLEDRPMFVQVAQQLGIHGLRHTDYNRTCKKLEKFGLK